MKFNIECEMKERWIPHFLGMLDLMQYNGAIGHSESIVFFSDGDGDFRPKFKFENNLPEPIEKRVVNICKSHANNCKEEYSFFDAG
jgi:hypothetical protein